VKKEFYKLRPDIERKAKDWLVENGYMEKSSFKVQSMMLGFLVTLFLVFLAIPNIIPGLVFESFFPTIAIISSAISIFVLWMLLRCIFIFKAPVKNEVLSWKNQNGFLGFLSKNSRVRILNSSLNENTKKLLNTSNNSTDNLEGCEMCSA
jgi:hypothetical protein